MTFLEANKIHCIGIGGIGISAIAKLLVVQGKRVTGSDAVDSALVREVAQVDVHTMIGHRRENVGDAEIVIYSEAVPRDNPERVEARSQNLPELSGAEALAELTKNKRLIAVSGTNGKSTVTALVGLLLEAGGLDPTVIVGSKVRNFSLGNVRVGRGAWFVLEADEYQGKFLHYTPEIAVVTNIEEDHLDYFRDLEHIRETYQAFLDRVRSNGRIVLNADDDRCMNDLRHDRASTTFGAVGPADYLARHIEVREGRQWFRLLRRAAHEEVVGEFSLQIPGRFNVMNALAALSVALPLGVGVDVAQAVLEGFPGIWRRFERVGEFGGAVVISDYGHHPTAVRGTVEAARDFYPDRRIVLIFQPHHHHRTKALFNDFVKSFAAADVVILPEIYSVRGREEARGEVSSQDLARAVREAGKVRDVHYGGTLDETDKLVKAMVRPGDLLLFMGAGDVDSLARRLVQ